MRDRGVKQNPNQVPELKAKGWKEDEECKRLALGHRNIAGGPMFLKDPSGRLHAVGNGRQRLLDGGYRRWAIALPQPGDNIMSLEARTGTVRSVEYADGRAVN
jgi:hypothetical protein